MSIIDPSQTQFHQQGGQYFAVNPRTGQMEPIVWSGLSPEGPRDADGLPTGEGSQPDYYFASEAPSGVASPLLVDQDGGLLDDIGDVLGGALTFGAGTAALGVGGATGASPITGMDPNQALTLDATGLLIGTGLGSSGVLNGVGGLTEATLLGGSMDDILGGVGDIFSGLGDFLPSGDTAAALAPIIAAIAYAQNQGPFDTSRLESTYNEFDPNLMSREFDQNTLLGRQALVSDLTRRGVTGSSFANMDRVNYNTARDLGRRDLINRGVLSRGAVANDILKAQIAERELKNKLYGTSLLALGNVFSGRNSGGSRPTGGGGIDFGNIVDDILPDFDFDFDWEGF